MQARPSDTVLGVLPALLDDLASRRATATVRQRSWAIMSALEHLVGSTAPLELARATVKQVTDHEFVESYISAARSGRLRARAKTTAGLENPRTLAARVSALRWLAQSAGLEPPSAYLADTTLFPISKRLISSALQAAHRLSENDDFYSVRTASTILMTVYTGAGTQELCRLQATHVTAGPGPGVQVEAIDPLPHHWSTDPTSGDTHAYLPDTSTTILTSWAAHRRRVVAALEGGDPGSYLVSGNPTAGRTPPGMPLKPRGLQRSYQRAIDHLAARYPDMVLPRTLTHLARAAWTYQLQPEL